MGASARWRKKVQGGEGMVADARLRKGGKAAGGEGGVGRMSPLGCLRKEVGVEG